MSKLKMVKNDSAVVNYWKYLKCMRDYESRLGQIKNQNKLKFIWDKSLGKIHQDSSLVIENKSIVKSLWDGKFLIFMNSKIISPLNI